MKFWLGLALVMPLCGQVEHFEGWKWKDKETDHFAIRMEGTGHDPVSKQGEKLWKVCVEVLPGLVADFEENEFVTPSGRKGAEEAPFRFTVYLLGEGDDFNQLVEVEAKRNRWNPNSVRLTKQSGNYSDGGHRYMVLCKSDPMRSEVGERDMTAVFVHSGATSLLGGRARSVTLPFWMRAGFGYYVEHEMFDLCRVHYLDFEAYYANQKAEIKKGETLGPDKSWATVLRRMCKKGERVSLNGVCTAQIAQLTPRESGYLFALTCFMLRDEPAQEKYRELVGKARDGQMIDKAALLKTYGYADDAALEEEWYAWIEGKEFK